MILFPTVPFTYTQSSLCLSAITPTLREVCSSSLNITMTLNYTKNTAGTASQYTFIVNGNGVNVCNSTFSQVSHTYGHTPNIPSQYVFSGTVSHQEGPICNDSSGDPSLPNIPAGVKSATNPQTVTYIFPYYYGLVPATCTSINAGNITAGNKQTNFATAPVSVTFNSPGSACKGFLAIPAGLGIQNSVTYTDWVDQNQFIESIPGGLFNSPSTVYPVTINGVNHTYSVYLFNYGTKTTGTWKFCS